MGPDEWSENGRLLSPEMGGTRSKVSTLVPSRHGPTTGLSESNPALMDRQKSSPRYTKFSCFSVCGARVSNA